MSQAASANTSAQATLPLAGAVKLGSAALTGTASSFTPASGSWGTYYLQADQLYLMLKGRVPTAAESTALATELAGGKTVIDAATDMLVNNPLYPATSNTPTNNAAFIDTLYRTALGRPPDTEGLDSWKAKLASPYNWSRGKVVYEIIATVYVYKGTSAAGLASQALFNNNTYAALYTVAGVADAYRLQVVAQAEAAEAARDVAKDVWDALKVIVTTNIGSATALQQANDGTVGLFTQQYGLRPKIEQTVDRWGNVLAVTDPRNAAWSSYSTYNANNQLLATSRNDTATTTITTENFYDQLGRLVATRDGRGYVNRNVYDERGNLVEEQHADGGVVHYDLNAFGERDTVHQANGSQIHYTYDKMGRVASTTRAYGPGVDAYYAIGVGNNNVETQLSAGEHIDLTEAYVYDSLGQRTGTLNVASGEVTEQVYDLRGNVIESIDAAQRSTKYSWDMFGHKAGEQAADGAVQGWGLDAWGRVMTYTDTATVSHTYSYNPLGLIKSLTATATGQNVVYTYDNASGLLVKIEDRAKADLDPNAAVQVTQYAYDVAGNRTREKTSLQKTVNGQVSELDVAQDNRNTYDRLGRLATVNDSRYSVGYEYDQNGNRTGVHTHYLSDKTAQGVAVVGLGAGADATTVNQIDTYNAYDEMNRQTIVDGVKVNGVVTIGKDLDNNAQGQRITYDLSGNRKTMEQWGKKLQGPTGSTPTWQAKDDYTTETYNYDAAGRLTDVLRDGANVDARRYDKAGRLVQSGGAAIPNEAGLAAALESAGVAIDRHYSDYNDKGDLLHQSTRARLNEQNTDAWFYNYDAAGRLLQYKTVVGGQANFYTYTYESWDRNKVHDLYVLRQSDGKHATTTHGYDTNGNLVQVKTEKDNWKFDLRDFVNDASGRVLRKTESGYGTNINNPYTPDVHVTTTLIANGEVVGSSSDDAAAVKNTFRSSYVPVTDAGYSAGPTAYTVQGTETLQMIARAVWGNADLWYVIADANGIDTVSDGDVIMIPAKPNTLYNSTSTFRPYDPTQAVGNTTPTLPAPDAKHRSFFSALGDFLSAGLKAAVAPTIKNNFDFFRQHPGQQYVDKVVMKNPALYALGRTVAGVVSTMFTGVAWGATAWDTYYGYLRTGSVSEGLKAAAPGMIANAIMPVNASSWYMAAATSALNNTVQQGVSVAMGQQDKFDWRGVAASAVGSGIGYEVSEALGGADFGLDKFGNQLARGTLSGLAGGTAAALMRGGKASVQQVVIDAFGQGFDSAWRGSRAYSSNSVGGPSPNAEIDAFENAVNGFSQAGADRFDGVNLAADMVGGVMYDNGRAAGPHINLPQVDLFAPTLRDVTVSASPEPFTHADFRQLELENVNAAGAGFDSEDLPSNFGPNVFAAIDEARRARGESPSGSITAIQPSFWERTWGSPEVQHVMNRSITGKLVGGVANFIGTGVSAFRADGYNPATLKHVYGVDKQRALQDTVIGLATLPIGGGGQGLARAELRSAMQAELRAAAQSEALATGRMGELQAKWGGLNAAERRVLLEAKSEATWSDWLAQRNAQAKAINPNTHFAERHGPGTTLEAQEVRATTKVTPDNAIDPAYRDSTRFMSSRGMGAAMQRADSIFMLNGRVNKAYAFSMDGIIGEGYTKAPNSNWMFTTNVNAVYRNGQPYTMFPLLRPVP